MKCNRCIHVASIKHIDSAGNDKYMYLCKELGGHEINVDILECSEYDEPAKISCDKCTLIMSFTDLHGVHNGVCPDCGSTGWSAE